MNERRTIFCLLCGQTRTLSLTQGYRPYASEGEQLACLRCGGETFTADERRRPIFPKGYLVTSFDRGFLRRLGIATRSTETISR